MRGDGRAAPAIEISLRPSRQIGWWTLLVHGAALAGLAATALPDWAVAGLAAAVLVSAVWTFRLHATRLGAHAVRRLVWTRDGAWLLADAAGTHREGALLPGALVTPRLIVLSFRLSAGGRRSVVLTTDSCDAEQMRRLRVRLRSEPG